MIEDVVRRFQERIRGVPAVDYTWQEPLIRPRPPVPPEVLAQAEARLGFALPPLLRALYTQVGDGGYGPGRGLDYLMGDDWSLVAQAERTCVEAAAAGDPWWPPRLVPFVSWGGHYTSCVDCSGPPYAVWFYDHDWNLGEVTQADYLYPEAASLEAWLSAWLDGIDLWEIGPKRRKDAGQANSADSE
jgi:SMI1 / KNR4 family (SUKH-1)